MSAAPRLQARDVLDIPAFEAHPLLRTAWTMTLVSLARPVRFERRMPSERRVVRVDDETSVVAHCSWQPVDAPALLIVLGLTGSADSTYVRGTARKAFTAGMHAVRLDLRNAGGSEGLTPTLQHGGQTDDVAALVDLLLAEPRVSEVHVAGFSMGGNQVLNLAAQWGDDPPARVASVCGVSPAIDLLACSRRMDEPGLFLARRFFLARLRELVRKKAELFPGRYDVEALDEVRTLHAFDARYIAPPWGFASADDYYLRASALSRLPRISVPTLLIQADDDELVPASSFERDEVTASPAVRLRVTRGGGHCAFVARRPEGEQGTPARDRAWAEHRVVAFARAASQVSRGDA